MPVAHSQKTMQIDGIRGGHLEAEARRHVVEVDMLNLNLTAFQSQEFIVGIAVAAILVAALAASSLFRNLALALAAGAVVLLYLQGGVAALIATSTLVEKEIRSLPDFSNGLVVGLAVSAVLMIGLQKRST
jgi:ethanolamine utilization microcompartment shell protein EutS